nr:DUF924 family protein [Kordiimonas gwangyangensis]
MRAEDILYFWFTEAGKKGWWEKNKAFDDLIRRRFGATYEAARQGELYDWRARAEGRLAEIIILDQFPRNMFRDSARAFESDAMALALSRKLYACALAKAGTPTTGPSSICRICIRKA